MEIKDWWVARELDVIAANYILTEEREREVEREKRDRDFWTTMFGSKSQDSDYTIEEAIEKSPLSRPW